ncbi:MAG: hypothetical protein JRJ69_13875 [Deltaproteobacteria bacterium]|nr:hypothetical protein [Deltaproteobacteria bacterium]
MRKSGYMLFLGGLALFTLLIGYHGLADVAAALAVALGNFISPGSIDYEHRRLETAFARW